MNNLPYIIFCVIFIPSVVGTSVISVGVISEFVDMNEEISPLIYEEHSITEIRHKSYIFSKQPRKHDMFKYEIVVETGEIFNTNLEDLKCDFKYTFGIHEYVGDTGLYRYISSVTVSE